MSTADTHTERRQLTQIILQAQSAAEALKRIYEHRKGKSPSLSLATLSKKLGIKSKANLSDVFNSRRTLNLRHRKALLKALNIQGLNATYLLRWLEHDFCRSRQVPEELVRELKSLKKVLKLEFVETSLPISSFGFKVFCALGLFKNSATLKDLADYFSDVKQETLLSTLQELEQMGAIEKKKEVYVPTSEQVFFEADMAESFHLNLLKQGLIESQESIERYMGQNGSHFETTIISVEQKVFERELEKFKESLTKFRCQVESGSADKLIRISVQIHPA